MCGPTGHGKTWAATWALASRDGAVFVTARAIRVTKPTDTWSALLTRALEAPLVVFDELGHEGGKEGGSSWASDEAAGLLEERQTLGRPTIITSNVPFELADVQGEDRRRFWEGKTIVERYGDRLARRLRDVETGRRIAVVGAFKISDVPAERRRTP